ncbi:effector-associated domain EAD1-containing protein [Burkholderia semiarida]|uniref:GAP1-N1 domain-containing protein n=1 Tax=Burkholderia TaxID=32008 RepID=UPI00265E40AC|nr:effector-associated domain EAD1-containing protein [Burkholderia sp. AU44665]MDN7702824.1 effector-associated domain EAD1-containing protein [Burkholderia sp. AU44665]
MTAPVNAPVYPVRARYGERDKTHALLSSTADETLIPATLLELTDKPPGYTPSGERWWPSVGCGPIGQWWVLWWTMPDERATRGGMVRSEVSLWPLDCAPDIQDLAAEMAALNGGESFYPAPSEMLATVAESLIAGNVGTPVLGDLDMWPSILAGLWHRLWPDARKCFAARVAISPPAGGESVSPPWLYAVSPERINQWPHASIIPIASAKTVNASRGARWVSGENDAIIEELIAANEGIGQDLSGIRRISRAAERLESLRKNADAPAATELLRTLCAIAPERNSLARFKSEALAILDKTLPTATASLVNSLANIRLSELPEGADTLLTTSVENWSTNQLPQIRGAESDRFLSLALAGQAEQWWVVSARAGIKRGIRSDAPVWPPFLLRWLSSTVEKSFSEVLGVNLGTLEDKLLTAASAATMSDTESSVLRQNTRTLRWSRLHALATLSVLPPKEALQSQLTFTPDPIPGLNFLVDRISGPVLVGKAVEINDTALFSLVARRTVTCPELLGRMKLSQKAWRTLWELHIEAGGVPWPSNVSRDDQAKEYLAFATSEGQGASLISRFASDFASAALGFPDRRLLWGALDKRASDSLATEVASLILQKVNTGENVACPEPILLAAVCHIAAHSDLTAYGATCLLIWQPQISEYAAERIVDRICYWHEPGVTKLGRLVLDRGWRRIARWLISQFRFGSTSVLPAIHACADLYNFWDLLFIPAAPGTEPRKVDRNQLILRVADLGSELAAARLDELWQRAGGKRGVLLHSGTASERWHDAATKAASGALGEGLMSLVSALLDDLPNNPDLKALERIIQDSV